MAEPGDGAQDRRDPHRSSRGEPARVIGLRRVQDGAGAEEPDPRQQPLDDAAAGVETRAGVDHRGDEQPRRQAHQPERAHADGLAVACALIADDHAAQGGDRNAQCQIAVGHDDVIVSTSRERH
jgi:hypothetical protein